jgi:hypothetical protein
MKIIINSDILYNDRLVRDYPSKRLQKLFRACSERGHVIVIPLTALLEFNRKQSEVVKSAISRLESAYGQLDKFKIPYTRVEPSQAVKSPALVGLIEEFGVEVMVECPTMKDFMEAHKRTCLHEPPHPPDAKSHEMRDMVIWMIALRLALQDGGALLISHDKVHCHPRGDDEAIQVGLVRVRRIEEALEYFIEEALEYFDVETPVGKLVEQLLAPVWSDLVDAGLPVTSPMSLMGVSQARFIQGIRGPSSACCFLKARASDGKTLEANTKIYTDDGMITKIILSDISVENELWGETQLVVAPSKMFDVEHDDYAERLSALKALLGE